ncbi:hypothetical protein ILUMI_07054 [Ignelater luminosus]|uniref:Uncharacterized protein n=1 Tax=Ignelater luminosus TaxID=2038154 RepID=A0A8K0D460_IGNLU|nr:hypothetical protein ILUMI_07054 [Ignelater luminosus]
MQNCLESMEYVLKLGVDINKQDKYGETPLFCATRMGKLAAIKLLLKFDADINKSDAFKITPLHVATERGFNECAAELIDSGANVNLSSVDGCTPLFIAVKKGNEELVKLLIENKANVNKDSSDILIKNGFQCIRRKNVEVSENRLSPLHVGIQCRNLKIVIFILESKVKINQTDNNNWTALHFAADVGYTDCISYLLKKGAGLHLQAKDGSTPIHLATKRNQHETLKVLVDESNCIKALNKFDNNMQTALHLACLLGYLDCVKILVAKGAALDIFTNEGYTPADLAKNQGHQDVQSFLEKVISFNE